MQFSFGMPFGTQTGVLPANCHLVVENVYFDEAASAGDLMAFDTGLIVATSFNNGAALSSGVPTSAWGRVRDPDISTALARNYETNVWCWTSAAVAAGGRGDVTVMGEVTVLKVGSAADHAVGATFLPSAATPEKVCIPFVNGTTLSTNAHNRKVIVKALTAGTSTNTLYGHLNGFGWGFVWCNSSGFNTDS